MNKFNTPQRLIAGGLLVLGGMTLSGCSSEAPNYAGRGNEFQVRGIVHDVEDDGTIHINEKQIVVESALGRSATWFKNNDGHNAFSDNFNFEPIYRQEESGWFGDCEPEVRVGIVYGDFGNKISPQQLKPGEVVEISGAIRDSNYWKHSGKYSSCSLEEYPTYNTATVVNGPLR